MLRVIVARSGRLDRVEAGHHDRCDRRVGGPCQHDVGAALADQLAGVTDRVKPGRAAVRHHRHRTFGGHRPRDLGRHHARRQVIEHVGGEEILVDQPSAAAVGEHQVLALQAGRSRDRAAEANSDAVRVQRGQIQPAVLDRVAGAHHGELGRSVHPADLARGQALQYRVEGCLGRDLRPVRGRIEVGDPPGRRPARGQQVPELLGATSTRGAQPDTRDHHTAGHCRPPQGAETLRKDITARLPWENRWISSYRARHRRSVPAP
jgi:hypothetical protein